MLKITIAKTPVDDYIVYTFGVVNHVVAGISPVRPGSPVVTFFKDKNMALPNVKGLVTPVPLASDNPDHVIARRCDVGLANPDGTQLPLVTVDVTGGAATFDAVLGQTYSVTDVDTNTVGDSLPSPIASGTVALPATVPATPGAPTVTFFDPDAPSAAAVMAKLRK